VASCLLQRLLHTLTSTDTYDTRTRIAHDLPRTHTHAHARAHVVNNTIKLLTHPVSQLSLTHLPHPCPPTPSGPVFARVTLVYKFSDGGNVTLQFTLFGADSFATVDET
jgi:predicted ATPase